MCIPQIVWVTITTCLFTSVVSFWRNASITWQRQPDGNCGNVCRRSNTWIMPSHDCLASFSHKVKICRQLLEQCRLHCKQQQNSLHCCSMSQQPTKQLQRIKLGKTMSQVNVLVVAPHHWLLATEVLDNLNVVEFGYFPPQLHLLQCTCLADHN